MQRKPITDACSSFVFFGIDAVIRDERGFVESACSTDRELYGTDQRASRCPVSRTDASSAHLNLERIEAADRLRAAGVCVGLAGQPQTSADALETAMDCTGLNRLFVHRAYGADVTNRSHLPRGTFAAVTTPVATTATASATALAPAEPETTTLN